MQAIPCEMKTACIAVLKIKISFFIPNGIRMPVVRHLNTRRQWNSGLMVGHRLRRRPYIEPGLGLRLVFDEYDVSSGECSSKHETLNQCWFNVGPVVDNRPILTLTARESTLVVRI